MRLAWNETWGVGWHGGRERARLDIVEACGSFLAIGALIATTWAGALAQSPSESVTPSASSSQSPDVSTATPPVKEWMIAGYGGAPYTYNSDVAVTRPGTHDFTAHDVGWDGEPFIDPIYYGVRIVRWSEGGQTGAMLDFTHSKTLSRLDEQVKFSGTINGAPAPEAAKLRDIFRRLEASHGHNMLTLNGLLRLPALSPRLIPYVGLGGGISLPHSEVQMQEGSGPDL